MGFAGAGFALGAFFPGFGAKVGGNFDHGDAVFYGADAGAEIAAYALGFVDAGDAGERGWIGAVAGGVATEGCVTFTAGHWRDCDRFPALLFVACWDGVEFNVTVDGT